MNRFNDAIISDDDNEVFATIWLARTNNIGPITFQKLINKYSKPSIALAATKEILKSKNKSLPAKEIIEKEIEFTRKAGAEIITIFDKAYPALLAEIDDAPIVISVKGDINRIGDNNIAMVGARYCSANATTLSYKLAKEICGKDFTVVSGLARGIDTAAHKGALDAKGKQLPTVAVVAGGIDNIYPPENEKLFAAIADKGVIITENQFGAVPKAENFPRRNRIISGLSRIVCVVEAALKSGSLITARYALEQGREIACIPGFPLDPRSEGTNELIKNGAALVTSSNDLIELMGHLGEQKLSRSFFSENIADGYDVENDIIVNSAVPNNIDLISVLSITPTSIDELIEMHNLSASEINAKLLEHEIAGEIIRHHGNMVSKTA